MDPLSYSCRKKWGNWPQPNHSLKDQIIPNIPIFSYATISAAPVISQNQIEKVGTPIIDA